MIPTNITSKYTVFGSNNHEMKTFKVVEIPKSSNWTTKLTLGKPMNKLTYMLTEK